ncbi:hypothetical protein GCM10011402_36980 [Paracoccus acridae]|uniref:Uncharacterized protein n=1 Tax=Paracoccus acridae TaxID=1795310 RepID=A0ABQ1VMN2_9RHOB|nr:hypothetical protein GCM10011402_36980 [Paracoccus acridae]
MAKWGRAMLSSHGEGVTLTDEDHANLIQTAVFKLNAAIEAAAKDGLLCELMTFHNHADARSIPTPVVFAKPYRPV